MVRIWKRGSVEQYSAAPYLATIANCGLWTLFGLPMVHPHSLLVVTINVLGMAMELSYLFLYLYYSDRIKRLKLILVLLAEIIFTAGFGVAVLTTAHTIRLRSAIIGSVAVAASAVMYAAPLSVMRLVVSTQSVEYMQFSIALASLLNGICWIAYSLIGTFDPCVLHYKSVVGFPLQAPSGLGAVFGLAQMILYGAYYKSNRLKARWAWLK
ncbi:bidirectional sugar transporter SWEET4-like [Diospyros lotus]|uniref:bidirectional sugar transporter SWEET4-like n=1 Tax=Diospyros lotus TaxID=55363 RepID=UPI00224D4294|nr:bidirectional sugar transporter SWEET4-like [Diospyros lotus]